MPKFSDELKYLVTLTDDLTKCKKTEWMFEKNNDIYFLFEDDIDLLGEFDWCAERDKRFLLKMEIGLPVYIFG